MSVALVVLLALAALADLTYTDRLSQESAGSPAEGSVLEGAEAHTHTDRAGVIV